MSDNKFSHKHLSLVELLTNPDHKHYITLSIFENTIYDPKDTSDDVVNCYGLLNFTYCIDASIITIKLTVVLDYWLEKDRIIAIRMVDNDPKVPSQIIARNISDFDFDDLDKLIDFSAIEKRYFAKEHPNAVLQSLIVGCKCLASNMSRPVFRQFPKKSYGCYFHPTYD